MGFAEHVRLLKTVAAGDFLMDGQWVRRVSSERRLATERSKKICIWPLALAHLSKRRARRMAAADAAPYRAGRAVRISRAPRAAPMNPDRLRHWIATAPTQTLTLAPNPTLTFAPTLPLPPATPPPSPSQARPRAPHDMAPAFAAPLAAPRARAPRSALHGRPVGAPRRAHSARAKRAQVAPVRALWVERAATVIVETSKEEAYDSYIDLEAMPTWYVSAMRLAGRRAGARAGS